MIQNGSSGADYTSGRAQVKVGVGGGCGGRAEPCASQNFSVTIFHG